MTLLERPEQTLAPGSDLAAKLDRVRSLLTPGSGRTAISLTTSASLSWLLDGARVGVALNGAPVAAALVTRHDLLVTCFENERDRLVEEELPYGLDVRAVPWHADLVAMPGFGSATPESEVATELRALRAPLLPLELSRYRALCAEVAAAMTDTLAGLAPDHSERSAAAAMTSAVGRLGGDALVVLAAGRGRLGHRHPLPTDAPLGDRAMIVVCARRHGMIANLTRWVGFGETAQEERDAEGRVLDVERDVLDATLPGRHLDEVFDELTASYPRHGFDALEWTRHHQGGPTGYLGRDPRATPGLRELIVENQVVTWNPSVPLAKVEDTVLVASDGVEVLTADPRWPTVEVGGRRRPLTLSAGMASPPSTDPSMMKES